MERYDARMAWVFVGLGNPDGEFSGTRHNAGRLFLQELARKEKCAWKDDAKTNSLTTKYDGASCVLPETYMNKSGSAVAKFVKSVKAAEKLLVIYDDMDLPLGKIKISFDRSSGGHNGLKSIERAVKTKKFWRLRIGVSPSTASGKLKKPSGEKDVIDFILGKFKPSEQDELKKVFKKCKVAIDVLIEEGPMIAMNRTN